MTAFRKLVATVLLSGIILNCFSHWLLFSSYTLNRAYIATVLCTNIEKPELHCEGKCFMDIKLKELEKKNKHDQENLKRMIETLEPAYADLLTPMLEISIKSETPAYLQQKPIRTVVSIFQPPKLV